MAYPRRRVSYIIPPPSDSLVPRLQFPPHGVSKLGHSGPLLIPYRVQYPKTEENAPKDSRHPRHRLGVSSLALDCSTHLEGRTAPEGILYSGGRDGLVMSWDLGIPMKSRVPLEDDGLRIPGGRWEIMTGWGDDPLDDEADDDDKPTSDGDILGDVTAGDRRKRKAHKQRSIPYDQQWETDLEAFKPGQVSSMYAF